ncbi:hypothetical protein DFH09DRAFT_1074815 [Mycena vulgaris]|nr:hypothetical protein DFH09DRAFT_1074815 [Mycena vulgaris]
MFLSAQLLIYKFGCYAPPPLPPAAPSSPNIAAALPNPCSSPARARAFWARGRVRMARCPHALALVRQRVPVARDGLPGRALLIAKRSLERPLRASSAADRGDAPRNRRERGEEVGERDVPLRAWIIARGAEEWWLQFVPDAEEERGGAQRISVSYARRTRCMRTYGAPVLQSTNISYEQGDVRIREHTLSRWLQRLGTKDDLLRMVARARMDGRRVRGREVTATTNCQYGPREKKEKRHPSNGEA